ncbi:MRC1-like domain-containing protein [Pseudomassariella vexata]|uniref:MRC1-like domain-domain-containing protein n=1 Tax=Pseudomassariella vexata TaxID=1141098 RepID=A0A1Y2DD92_9PEZI|nr:MRC1-like domain-containing protein [Pseudomassariella vexata]ORY57252.1 MRC1-like domain-domain-containing protein [Pseudomassariella vexata]
MASTRSSSPANGASPPTSPQLTPRSKIKAMMDAVDVNSDEEDARPIDPKILFQRVEETIKSIKTSSPTQKNDGGDEEEEDEDDIIRPRGRLAARMLGAARSRPSRSSNSPGTVQKSPRKSFQRHAAQEGSNHGDAGNDDDEELNPAHRRRRARAARNSTPESTLQIQDSRSPASPGLFVSPDPSPQKSTISRRSAAGSDNDTDDELPSELGKSARFQALVARKREERQAKEAEEERKRHERAKRMVEQVPADSDVDDDDVSDITDDDGGRKLTQEVSRPSRKASKKALEEMNRETQRMSRSLQLTHEAKTKKKISKASLFERFHYKPQGSSAGAATVASDKLASSSRPSTPISAAQTDIDMGEAASPPSSPPSVVKKIANASLENAEDAPVDSAIGEGVDGELPDLQTALTQVKKIDEGKGKATLADLSPGKKQKAAPVKPKRQYRVKMPPVQANHVMIDSEDELQITGGKQNILDVILQRLPAKKAQESRGMHALRQLAHLSSPPKDYRKRNQKPAMTVGELQLSLQQLARAQAKLRREEKIEELRAKGHVVQSAEERERERDQIDDIVAKAMKEAEEIMAREREDAKKAKKESRKNGEEDPLGWDDSDDDSYDGSEEEVEPEEVILSGSEEEVEDEMMDDISEDDEEKEDEPTIRPMFDEDAEEDAASEDENTPQATASIVSDEDMDDVLPTSRCRSRRAKNVQIISDDEEEEEEEGVVQATPRPKTSHPKSPAAPNTKSPKIPTSVLRSATKTFIPGLPVPAAGPAGLGLTQIFAGTMDDENSQEAPASGSSLEFMPSFDNFPDSQFSATAGASQNADNMVLDSQTEMQKTARETQTQGIQLRFEQSQAFGFDSLLQMDGSQMSDILDLEPTQDGGFADYSPLKQRFVEPPSGTVDTVILSRSPDEAAEADSQTSPLVRKRGRLMRRAGLSVLNEEDSSASLPPTATPVAANRGASLTATATENIEETQAIEDAGGVSAFKLMQKAAKRAVRRQKKFDANKSKAKELVEGEAEESEDEYAGLGGVDGEDSSDEDEELHKQMIDDAARNDLNEDKLAAFFADRERAADAANVDKLFRDITTGMLRKRRRNGGGNNDFDLSDSDDGGEARRRMKRKQFAKMQKALFADERIGKIAENPRNAAFLKSIEDRNSDDEWDFADNFEEKETSQEESQSTGQEAQQEDEAIPDSQPRATAVNVGRKRMRTDVEPAVRPAPHLRRTKDGTKPASLVDVRRSLSSLLDDSSSSIIPATQLESDSEDESESNASSNKENRRPGSVAVVDRISLKRSGSSNLSTGSNVADTSRLAFAAPTTSTSGAGIFKVPALLRRATTNSSLISNTSSTTPVGGSTTNTAGKGAGGFGDEAKLKKNAGKRSGINYFARENERREKIRESEQRREAKKWKGVEGRSKVVGGLFGRGSFE